MIDEGAVPSKGIAQWRERRVRQQVAVPGFEAAGTAPPAHCPDLQPVGPGIRGSGAEPLTRRRGLA